MPTETRVLLIEDDEDNAFLISLTLERAGARVRTAATIRQALELAGEAFDLVVSDVHLPDGEGPEVLARWPRTASRPPAIALTGDTDDRTRARLEEAGFDVVLQKPVLPEVLVQRVRQLLGERSPRVS